jgi:hypothetical protein
LKSFATSFKGSQAEFFKTVLASFEATLTAPQVGRQGERQVEAGSQGEDAGRAAP